MSDWLELQERSRYRSQMEQVTRYWLVKSEPSAYSWSDLVRDRVTSWTGVRNFQARNNLRAMKKSDRVLFYHSVAAPSVMAG